ncbi:hypothetical protein TNCV_4370581 [Trichonephila clavipes]|uniref:Uncharacterized protein n=1 Tax=Trichonephila clavipes TaxID=2585209 RepID=A0A8X6S686_TRICX|nr:hypothetical protein TNCV_4370581 [Trichonephila clavipes]
MHSSPGVPNDSPRKGGCMLNLSRMTRRSGRPQTIRNAAVVDKVEYLVMEDRRLTVRETAEQVEISTGSPQAI